MGSTSFWCRDFKRSPSRPVSVWRLPLAELARPPLPEAATTKLLVVQPAIPRYARWEPKAQPWILETVSRETSEALAQQQGRVDAIVWPENLLTTPLEADSDLAGSLQRNVDAWGVPLITGLLRAPTHRAARVYRSSVVWLEPQRGVVAALDKFRAIPLLEASRAPSPETLLAPLFGEAARWPKVEEAATPGSSLAAGFGITPALCCEVLFAQIVALRRSPQSLAILDLADDSWVTGETARRQLTAWAAFRAIEQRLPLIRVAHGCLSPRIDPFGRIVETLPSTPPPTGPRSFGPSRRRRRRSGQRSWRFP